MLSNISITIFNQRKITTLSKCALVRLMKGYIFLLYRSIRHGFTCVMEHVYIYIHASGVAIINQTFLKITEKLRSTFDSTFALDVRRAAARSAATSTPPPPPPLSLV